MSWSSKYQINQPTKIYLRHIIPITPVMTGINDFSFSPKIHHKFGTISQSMVGTYSDILQTMPTLKCGALRAVTWDLIEWGSALPRLKIKKACSGLNFNFPVMQLKIFNSRRPTEQKSSGEYTENFKTSKKR